MLKPMDRRQLIARLALLGLGSTGLSTLAACQGAPTGAAASRRKHHAVRYKNGAVAADHPLASEVGVDVLRAGGNAIDAAIAVNATLGVVRPYSCGLGGGGFLVAHDERTGRSWAMNARETAPKGVWESYFTDLRSSGGPEGASRYGGHAVAVPGTPNGLFLAHRTHGTMSMSRLLAPAAEIARDGFEADASHVGAVNSLAGVRARLPWTKTISQWTWKQWCLEGTVEVGSKLSNQALADTLDALGRHGIDAWRSGTIPTGLARVARASGGKLNVASLAEYRADEIKPLTLENRFFGATIVTMPPPSSGGIAIAQILATYERLLEAAGRPSLDSAMGRHLLIEAMKPAFALRARYLADPAFAPVPVDDLLKEALVERMVSEIETDRARTAEEIDDGLQLPDDEGTSHLCVIDGQRQAVAWTSTINGTFGSLVGDPESGILLNNEMDDFTTIQGEANLYGLRQSDWNLPVPGKRPLSSMSPTILLDEDGSIEAIAGASGGPRIISATLQVLLGMSYGDLDAAAAIDRSRVHHQWRPDSIRYEEDHSQADSDWRTSLENMGHTFDEAPRGVAVVQAIRVHPDGFDPASDPRKLGVAAGY